MELAVWGHLWTDAEREGGPEGIVARCRSAGIGTYLCHTNPIARSPAGYYSPGHTWDATVYQGETFDRLGPLLRAARGQGLEVEPWLLPFTADLLAGERREDLFPARAYQSAEYAGLVPGVEPRRPDLPGAAKNGTTLCPSWAENRDRAVRILRDLIERHDPDLGGIDLDMVRYPNADTSWHHPCHCAACRTAYRQRLGCDLLTPEALQDPGVAYAFTRFRSDVIGDLVQETRDLTRQAGLRLTVSARADFFGSAALEGQDWPRWAREGLVDAVFTMSYWTDRALHRRHARQHAALMAARGACRHYDGVGRRSSLGENPMDRVLDLARDALAAGADGVSVFHYNALTDGDFARLRELG
ncbi:MAG: hypothetical protein ABIL09_21955 [Gemmatimonadota bacterium]